MNSAIRDFSISEYFKSMAVLALSNLPGGRSWRKVRFKNLSWELYRWQSEIKKPLPNVTDRYSFFLTLHFPHRWHGWGCRICAFNSWESQDHGILSRLVPYYQLTPPERRENLCWGKRTRACCIARKLAIYNAIDTRALMATLKSYSKPCQHSWLIKANQRSHLNICNAN